MISRKWIGYRLRAKDKRYRVEGLTNAEWGMRNGELGEFGSRNEEISLEARRLAEYKHGMDSIVSYCGTMRVGQYAAFPIFQVSIGKLKCSMVVITGFRLEVIGNRQKIKNHFKAQGSRWMA